MIFHQNRNGVGKMKVCCGKWGLKRYYGLGIILLLFAFPVSTFPQQKKQSIDTLAVEKNKQLVLPDSLKLKGILINTTIQDSATKLKQIFKSDSTFDILQNFKPDYSNLEVKIEINNGAPYAKSQQVMLNLTAPQATEMMLGNSEDLSGSQWEPFQPYKNWTLSEQDGSQKVYFCVRYPDSTLSKTIFDEIILSSTPPVANFRVTPDSGIANETFFTFDATEITHSFDIFLRWDWDDDGKFDTDWSSTKQEMHQYRFGGGPRRIRLEVKDTGGWVVSATKEIVVYSRPYPDFTYSQDFVEPLKITFDASSSGDYEDGNNLQYRWDCNADSVWDSDWSTDKTITFKFDLINEVQVMVEAKDSQGLTNTYTLPVVNKFNDMVFVPAGDFIMGSNMFEIDERPVHEVYLDDFWIDKYPVTNQKYAEFLNEFVDKYPQREPDIAQFIDLSGQESKILYDAGKYVANSLYKHHPVVNVTWYGADAYCRFYNKRLPTEAEWEKAARGTDARIYAWGDVADSSSANYWNSGDPFDDNTTPVGFYNGQNYKGFHTSNSPSYFGAYDMGGNVKEWVFDWYLRNYYSQTPKVNPTGPQTGTRKVVRGGGYLFHVENLRVTYRYAMLPEKSANFIGFRCLKSLPK